MNPARGTLTHLTSAVLTLPTGIVAGNLLVAFVGVRYPGGTTAPTWPAGWTSIAGGNVGSAPDGRGMIAYRVADGSEGATIALTLGQTTQIAYHIYRLTSTANPVAGTMQTTSFAQPDPPSLTSGFGAVATLWIAAGFWANISAQTVGYPSGYSDGIWDMYDPTGTGGAAVATARLANSAATEDAGAFSLNLSPWVTAVTVAVQAGVVAPDAAGSPMRVVIIN